jgi:hypothetical protein
MQINIFETSSSAKYIADNIVIIAAIKPANNFIVKAEPRNSFFFSGFLLCPYIKRYQSQVLQ